jgi:hypothetical protein
MQSLDKTNAKFPQSMRRAALANRNILWRFVVFYGNLVFFNPFWYVVPRKSGNPVLRQCT